MIVALTLVIFTVLLITVLLRQGSKYPPGPFSWPFVGNQFYLKKLSRKLGGQHLAFLELSKQYKSNIISLRLGLNNVIVICDSKLINEILYKEEYDGRPWNEFIKIRNMGMRKGITMNDGPEWKELRAWSVRTLRTVGFAQRHMTDLLTNEVSIILEKLKDTNVRYIRPVISPIVINVLWTLVTAQRPSEDSKKLQIFMDLMERRARVFDMAGGMLSTFPWIRHIAPETSGYNILQTLNDELKNLIMNTIDEHKKKYVPGSEVDFIDMFLREMFAQKDKDSVFTDENLLVTLIDFFIAGVGNTTATLDFFFLQMVNHQEAQRRLHEEIDTVIGSNRVPQLEDRIKMPYTESLLTECQRLWLVTPIIGPRRVLEDTTLAGYNIPKNSTILLNVFCNNMNPEFYPDPTAFKPERFYKNGAYQTDENIILFGKGHRRCPGEALARTGMFLIFVGIMQKYRLLPMPGKQNVKMEINPGLTLSAKPYEMLIVPR